MIENEGSLRPLAVTANNIQQQRDANRAALEAGDSASLRQALRSSAYLLDVIAQYYSTLFDDVSLQNIGDAHETLTAVIDAAYYAERAETQRARLGDLLEDDAFR